MNQSKKADRRAAGLAGLWVAFAGAYGGPWAISKVEDSLTATVESVPEVSAHAADGGSVVELNGRTAHVYPGSLSKSETEDLVDAVSGVDGVRSVSVESSDGPSPSLSQADDSISVQTTNSIPSTSATASTSAPATTSTSAPATTSSTSSDDRADGPSIKNEAEHALDGVLAGRTIEFVFSTALPTEATEDLLGDLIELMEGYPDLKLHIVGHTDPSGNPIANQTLSEARAQAVANYLIIGGIDLGRMTIEGKGSTEPIADNSSSAGKQQNRRVLITPMSGTLQGDK